VRLRFNQQLQYAASEYLPKTWQSPEECNEREEGYERDGDDNGPQ
jgi:hypothetical protein